MLVVANLSDQLLNKLQLWTENSNKSGMNLKRGLQKQIDIREFLPKVEFYINRNCYISKQSRSHGPKVATKNWSYFKRGLSL